MTAGQAVWKPSQRHETPARVATFTQLSLRKICPSLGLLSVGPGWEKDDAQRSREPAERAGPAGSLGSARPGHGEAEHRLPREEGRGGASEGSAPPQRAARPAPAATTSCRAAGTFSATEGGSKGPRAQGNGTSPGRPAPISTTAAARPEPP